MFISFCLTTGKSTVGDKGRFTQEYRPLAGACWTTKRKHMANASTINLTFPNAHSEMLV